MVGRRLPQVTHEDASSYILSVKETFHDEPEKYTEFTELLNGVYKRRIDYTSVIARVEELMKGHRGLLLGFRAFLRAEVKRNIHPDAEKVEQRVKSVDAKRKRADPVIFLDKLKTRFKSIDCHVVESFVKIMKNYKDKKMSEEEVHEEVIDLLYYHEDLIEEFSRIIYEE